MRGMLYDYDDLDNLKWRLKTFVDLPPSAAGFGRTLDEAVEVKPSIFGLTVDLKAIAKRLFGWVKKWR
jgi:hypothetical protein